MSSIDSASQSLHPNFGMEQTYINTQHILLGLHVVYFVFICEVEEKLHIVYKNAAS